MVGGDWTDRFVVFCRAPAVSPIGSQFQAFLSLPSGFSGCADRHALGYQTRECIKHVRRCAQSCCGAVDYVAALRKETSHTMHPNR